MNEHRLMLPLRLPGATITGVMDMVLIQELDDLEAKTRSVFPDDVFPGTQPLPAGQRLQHYLISTTAISDMALLAMPDYIDLYKQGQVPPPQSPFWLNALSIPDQFQALQRDFITLARRTQQ